MSRSVSDVDEALAQKEVAKSYCGNKYAPGIPLTTMGVLVAIQREEYVMFNGKPMHPAMVGNWSVVTIRRNAAAGRFHKAICRFGNERQGDDMQREYEAHEQAIALAEEVF